MKTGLIRSAEYRLTNNLPPSHFDRDDSMEVNDPAHKYGAWVKPGNEREGLSTMFKDPKWVTHNRAARTHLAVERQSVPDYHVYPQTEMSWGSAGASSTKFVSPGSPIHMRLPTAINVDGDSVVRHPSESITSSSSPPSLSKQPFPERPITWKEPFVDNAVAKLKVSNPTSTFSDHERSAPSPRPEQSFAEHSVPRKDFFMGSAFPTRKLKIHDSTSILSNCEPYNVEGICTESSGSFMVPSSSSPAELGCGASIEQQQQRQDRNSGVFARSALLMFTV